ncbi:MAG TPA: hypothetical protein VIW64_09655, partial [Pyrinomonadaceae bacterium]
FNLPSGTVGATLQDDGVAANNASQLASTNATFETTNFAVPTNSLTVNAGGGTDTITTAAGFSGDFNAALTINGTAATDSVTLNALNLGNAGSNSGNLSATGKVILVSGAIDTTAGTTGLVNLTGGQTVTVNASIKADADITLTAGSTNSNNAANVLTINADVTGLNGGSVILNGNSLVNNAATVSAANSGNIQANLGGTAGAATFNNGSVVSAVNGAINITAASSTTLNGTATLNITGTGSVTLTTDDLAIASTATLKADDGLVNGNNIVTIRNLTAGRTIALGSNTPGSLGLTEVELDRVKGEALRIGRNDASAAGTISLSSLIDLTTASTVGGFTVPTLHLFTGANVMDGTAGEQVDLKVQNLAIEAVTGIGAFDDLNLQVSNFAASNSGGVAAGHVTLKNTGALTIASVDGVVGLSSAGGSAGVVSIVAASPITINAPLSNTTGGDIILIAGTLNSNNPADVLTVNANVSASGGNGSVGLNGNSLIVNAAAVSTVGSGSVFANFGGTGAAVTFNNGSQVSAVNGFISVTGAASITLNGNANITGAGSVTLTSDDVAVASTAAISANDGVANGNNRVTIQNLTPGRAITLGANAPGTVGLTESELDRVKAETLRIGRIDPFASGVITFTAPIDFTSGANTIPLLDLRTGNAINGGGGSVAVANLILDESVASAAHTWSVTPPNFVDNGGGAVPYSAVTNFTIQGGSGNETFNVTPSSATTFNMNGNNPKPPASPGDSLTVDESGTTGANLSKTSTPSGFQGSFTFTNRQPVNFTTIETVNCAGAAPITITCPGGITKFTDPGQNGATVNPGAPVATGGCGGSPTVTGSRSDGKPLNALYPVGVTTITWTATDGSTSASCNQTIVIMVPSGQRRPSPPQP